MGFFFVLNYRENFFTFHSGYIPIYEVDGNLSYKDLYIPFWIYSNKHLRGIHERHKPLYIPFWIYSNIRKS